MSFGAPWFLLGLGGLVLPLAIHWSGRARGQRVRFAATELLDRIDPPRNRRHRLRDRWLLALRSLAVAALVLAFAKPTHHRPARGQAALLDQGGPQSIVVIVDDSLSMQRRVGDTSLFERARQRALELVDRAEAGGRGDRQWALVTTTSVAGPLVPLGGDAARVRQALGRMAVTYRPGQLARAVALSAQLLAPAVGRARRIVWIGDLQRGGLLTGHPGEGPSGASSPRELSELTAALAPSGASFIPVDVAPAGEGQVPDNRAVVDLRTQPSVSTDEQSRASARVIATVANFGRRAQTGVSVSLRSDGQVVATTHVDLPPRSRTETTFAYAPPSATTAWLSVAVEGDGLAGDDQRWAPAPRVQELRVLLVNGAPSTVTTADELFYLESALESSARTEVPLRLTTATREALLHQELSSYDVVALCNVAATAPPVAQRLEAFVRRGGGLLVTLGDQVDVAAYSRVLVALLPAPLEDLHVSDEGLFPVDPSEPDQEGALPGEPLVVAAPAHPLFAGAWSGLGRVRVARYGLLRPTPTSDAGRVTVLRLGSGAPALVEQRVGRGRVLLFVSTIDRDWTDLPLRPGYAPLVQRLVRYLGGGRETLVVEPAAPGVGQSVLVRLPTGGVEASGGAPRRVTMELPSGKEVTLSAIQEGGQWSARVDTTPEPGLYRLRWEGATEPLGAFAVQLAEGESDLLRWSDAELQALIASGSPTADGGGGRAAAPPRVEIPLAHLAGLLLLGLLAVEGGASLWGDWARRRAQRTKT